MQPSIAFTCLASFFNIQFIRLPTENETFIKESAAKTLRGIVWPAIEYAICTRTQVCGP